MEKKQNGISQNGASWMCNGLSTACYTGATVLAALISDGEKLPY